MADDVDSFLEHFGVKGMKWGVRKTEGSNGSTQKSRYQELRNGPLETLSVKTKHGQTVEISEHRKAAVASFVYSISKKGTENYKNFKMFDFKVSGKKVGDASFNWDKPDELNLVWLGINSKEQGKGYGSAVFDAAVKYGQAKGAKRLTLEVPGTALNARHIYEKQGFVVGKQITSSGDIWGGLTEMSLDLTKAKSLSHASISREEVEIDEALKETFPPMPPELEAELYHADVDTFLEHFGVKGMKWGVRKASPPVVAGRTVVKKKPMAEKASNLSDAELKKRIERLRMEEQYEKLTSPNLQNGMKVAKFLLGAAGSVLAGRVAGAAFDYATGYNGGASAYRTAIVVKDVLNARKAIGMG